MASLVVVEPKKWFAPVLAPHAGPDVCTTCRGPVRAGSVHCWCCTKVCAGLAIEPDSLPPVVPIGLYRPGDPWNAVLRRYKDAPVGAARRYFVNLLKTRTEQYLSLHGACLARETKGFDAYCVVPSSQRGRLVTAPHPLESVLGAIPAMRSFDVVRMSAGDAQAGHLRPDKAAFVPEEVASVTDRRILVVDDSWITGARALSAVTALDAVGATVAGVLILGRSVDTSASEYSRSWWAVHTTPVHTAPVHTAPVHTAPVHTTPVHTTPVHTTPVPRSVPFCGRCCALECLASRGRR